MDLVDIDKVLDDLEDSESKIETQSANSRPSSQSRPQLDSSSSSNRRIKVRSVLSSLNDYVDYDRKQPATVAEPDALAVVGCEQTAAAVAVVNEHQQSLDHHHQRGCDNSTKTSPSGLDSINTTPAADNIDSETVADKVGDAKIIIVSKESTFESEIDPVAISEEDPTPTSVTSQTADPVLEDKQESTIVPVEPPEVPLKSSGNFENVVKIPQNPTPGESKSATEESSNDSPSATHVTLPASTTDDQQTQSSGKSERVDCSDVQPPSSDGGSSVTESTIASDQVTQVPPVDDKKGEGGDEEDLEKYLDDLVTEYESQIKLADEVCIISKSDESTSIEPNEVESNVTELSKPTKTLSLDMEPTNDDSEPHNKKSDGAENRPIEGESELASEEQRKEEEKGKESKTTTEVDIPHPSEQPSNNDDDQRDELNLDELRELEKLMQQQELEEQMELDRQMALKLQEDGDEEDLDLAQAMANSRVDASAAETASPSSSPLPAESESGTATEQRTSPLEAPRSASVRIVDDDPEYRYLITLGKQAPYWVPDTTHDNCMQCDQKFSLLKRRHHCRCCGELLCATCCSFRTQLEYMREQQQMLAGTSTSMSASTSAQEWPEARICTKCDKLMQRRDELLQLRYLAECGIGEDSGLAEFPIKGVLKKPKAKATTAEEDEDDEATTTDNSDSTATPTKTVIFSDGIRPGHDGFNGEEEGSRSRRRSKPINVADAPIAKAVEAQSPSESEMVARARNSYKAFLTALKTFYNPQNQSYLPPIKTHLPPMLKNCGGFLPVVELQNNFTTCQSLCDFLKTERRDFLVQKRLYCAVQIIDYRVDANQLDNQCRWCLNVTTNGMSLLGQQELVILVEMNPEYFASTPAVDDKRNLKFLLLLMRRLFVHFNKIYMRIHTELGVEMRAKRKMEVAQLQHPDPSLLLLDNRVLVAPFAYFNKTYTPQLGGVATTRAPSPSVDSSNGNESDESENSYICDKYTFLKPKNYVQHMDLLRVTFGTKGDVDFYLDFNAVLYVRATFQSTQNVLMPERRARGSGGGEVLFGLLVKQTEIPWAKLFPLRLLLRMGAEYRLYPWPLFNALDRKCLYSEFVDNSIIHFLADFRNFSYTLNEVPGLHMYMEHEKAIPSSTPDVAKEDNVRVRIFLPKINYKRIEAVINDSSESILSFAGALHRRADGHLVCIQQQPGESNGGGGAGEGNKGGSATYSTQSLNIERESTGGPSRTGLNFFILNGALKAATGLKAKLSIIEDGVMVQVLPGIMSQVRSALLEMRNFEIRCEESDEKVASGESKSASEIIEFVWTSEPLIETITGLKSEIDERSLENCSYVNVLCDYHKRGEPGKVGPSSSRGMFGWRTSNSRLEMDCFYLHLHKVILLEEENYFALFNEKMAPLINHHHESPEDEEGGDSAGVNTDENANLIKSLNVSNWEVPSINFLIKLSALLGRIVDRALSKHYSRLHDEKLRQIGVRFNFQPDHIVTYEAGSCGTKLPIVFLTDLDSHLIPMLHQILELNAKDAPSVMPFTKNGLAANALGDNLNAEFLDRISLLQNLQRGITFELVFDIVIDLP